MNRRLFCVSSMAALICSPLIGGETKNQLWNPYKKKWVNIHQSFYNMKRPVAKIKNEEWTMGIPMQEKEFHTFRSMTEQTLDKIFRVSGSDDIWVYKIYHKKMANVMVSERELIIEEM